MTQITEQKQSCRLLVVFSLLFVAWSAGLIYRSSIPLPDGSRAFCLFDDAMISMRYADNLAKGYGPVWNPGERVEGYTNPLMVGVMALFLIVLPKTTAVLLVQILGVVTVLVTAVLSVKIYNRAVDAAHRMPPWFVLVFVVSVYTLVYWSVMGMETGLVALFLCIGVYAVAFPAGKTGPVPRPFFLLVCSGAGLYLSRPDALLFFFVIWFFYILSRPRNNIHLRDTAALFSVLGIVIVHTLLRYWYYNAFIPNTVVLRLHQVPLSHRIAGGTSFVIPFLQSVFPLFGVAVYAVIMKPEKLRLLILSLFTVSVLYQVYVGGDPWAYWRIMTPCLPLLVVLACDGAFRLSSGLAGISGKPYRIWMIAALLLTPVCYVYNKPFLYEMIYLQKPYSTDENILNVRKAYAIRDVTKPSASVGVFWAGTIPFYSERYAVDFLGKTDPYIAGLQPDVSGSISWHGMSSVPGHNKYDLIHSVVGLRPTYIQTTRWGAQDITEWASEHYRAVMYRDILLVLLNDSPDVFWDKLEILSL